MAVECLVFRIFVVVIRPPDFGREGLIFYPWTLFIYFFLSIHGAQQPRSGWPSNVFKRFWS